MNPSHESTHQPNHKTRTELINWRRNKIIELRSQGHNQEEIAQTNQSKCLRQEAMENVKDYTTKELPLQFRVYIKATWNAIKEYWKISQNAHDNKEKMQALDSYVKHHRELCKLLGYEPELQSVIDNSNGNSFANNHYNHDYRCLLIFQH